MPVAPPFPRLPPLNALRAYEAAARLGGFAAAAGELGVTPGAVAAHVKALEQELGADLFERHSRGVRLTALGNRTLPGLVAAFDALGQAVRDLRREAAPRKVHVATLPALAQLWLSPRLPGLREELPDIDISITALESPPNLKRVPFDLCLFFTSGKPPNARNLGADIIFPVCAPSLAGRLRHPADLLRTTCLVDAAWPEDWTLWAAHAMPGTPLPARGPAFSLYALALEEARNGAGVLMGHRALVQHDLASGKLVAPFEVEVPLPRSLTLWPQRSPMPREVENVVRLLAK
ncbi:MAG: LysR family transcriptional regulator [Geminicoccaceae bacterium]|nr:LysR family transcriptional regulator [Geminicoccaceae bacterium]MCB9942243.1 LysR family transcriptional regulator [Geminicoccaceae bacterium]